MKVGINELTSHPAHSGIYEAPDKIREDWKDLFNSISEYGMKQPIITTTNGVIISGHRRWMVAKELGWKQLEIQVEDVDDETAQSMLVQLNTNREKTDAEKINEALFLIEVVKRQQGNRNSPGNRLEIIAEKLGKGFSRSNVEKIEKIKEADEKSETRNSSLIELLKKGASIHSVYEMIGGQKDEKEDIEKNIKKEGVYELICGDSFKKLETIKADSVDMCFSSFPYWDLKIYKDADKGSGEENWGEEKKMEDYVKNTTQLVEKIYRTLKETGSFYLNLGDTIRGTQYQCVPERVCLSVMALGFKLVNKIVWVKKNPKPSSSKNQLQPTYEFVYHFVKDVKKFKNRKIRFKSKGKHKVLGKVGDIQKNGLKGKKKGKVISSPYKQFRNFYEENEEYSDIIKTAVARSQDVKKITGGDHPAIFPFTLPLFAILQSTEVGDVVMDCCSGSGTLGACTLFGRKYIGIELSDGYHKDSINRLEYFANNFNEEEMNKFESYAMAA
jgi:ParB/RepB/Spo0J family partition protein